MKINKFLELLDGVKKSGDGYVALCPCPVHGDKEPSLSISMGDDGRILLKCFAGCEVESIVQALGLEMKDLFNDSHSHIHSPVLSEQVNRLSKQPDIAGKKIEKVDQSPVINPEQVNRFDGCTLEQYAETKKLPIEFLLKCGMENFKIKNTPCIKIPYLNHEGILAAVRYRTSMDSKDRFRWRTGDKPIPYGLWQLGKCSDEEIVLVEGESDCHTLWQNGIPAVGIPGASSWKESRDAPYLSKFQTIYVIIEPDTGGEKLFNSMCRSSLREKVRVVHLPLKDASALYLDDPAMFQERLSQALSQAEPIEEEYKKKLKELAREAWERCKDLAKAPDVLDRVVRKVSVMGVVGEERSVKLLYLALTSRVFNRPISMAIKGSSSSGKSFVLESILKLMPPDAYYALTAMSDRALAYTDENLKHRFVILFEAAGLNSEFQSYLIRTLLSEGRIEYEFVEKTPEGMKPRRIRKDGPTGFICTTTSVSLHPENETRMLSITSNDTPEQTKNIIEGIAKQSHDPKDCDEYIAFQNWLSLQPAAVYIPYAEALAALIIPVAVRLRRDFSMILNLIKAHAFLCQCNREKNEQDNIIARLDDYDVAYDLVHDVISQGVEATVPEEVRVVVETVQQIVDQKGHATTQEVAQHTRLDRQAAQRRLKQAEKSGFAVNDNPGKGKKAKYIIGDPMPEDMEIIPSPSRLREYLQTCSLRQTCDSKIDQVVQAECVELTSSSENLFTCSAKKAKTEKKIEPEQLTLPFVSGIQCGEPESLNNLREVDL